MTLCSASSRYRHSPHGTGPPRSAPSRAITRIAAEVPTLSATRSGPEQSEPTFEQAPSPRPGYHRARARAGTRAAQRAVSPAAGASSMRGSWCAPIPHTASRAGSQSHVRWSISPVPEAMETLAVTAPVKRALRYSANPHQVRARSQTAGWERWSQRSLAG